MSAVRSKYGHVPLCNGLTVPVSRASGSTLPGSDYTADEWEFIRAMAMYQKREDRRYPAWSEVLAVVKSLGYRRVPNE